MRGRRGNSSSSVSQEQTRMALRKQTIKDVPCASQTSDDSTQEDEALDDNDDLSSSLLSPSTSRGKRQRERPDKSKSKEMTEEEMMDLALRLSEQEASVTALRLQKEEEAVMKAIQESMVSQTQPCPPSQSQSLLSDAEPSMRLCSRRKLKYSNGKRSPTIDQEKEETEPRCVAKVNLEESNSRTRKRKRKEESPLLEMPDMSQTQKIISQDSLCSSEPIELTLDSSPDSTQIDDCQFQKSPVFPLTGCRTAEVHVPRLSQDLLVTCRTSGYVLCSQDSWVSRPKSPTSFQPKSPKPSPLALTLPDSPVLSTDNDIETQLSPDQLKSPVFGRNIQQETSPSACRPKVRVCNSGFTSSSQESLMSTSCRSKSPVFPRSPGPDKALHPDNGSLHSSETDGEQTEQGNGNKTSQGLDLTEQNQRINPTINRNIDDVESQKEVSKQWASSETQLTSDMTLILSEEDEDVTLVGSPSPVFPEETPLHQPPVSAVSPGRTGLNNSPFFLASEESKKESAPVSHQGAPSSASAHPQEPAARPTVHYYWGVPFCPRGLDPDSYTKVILAQMEVYEKSLKQAQRSLMRKAEWGEAILPQPERSPSPECPSPESPPQPVHRRRGLRLKAKKLCEVTDSPQSQAEEEEKEVGEVKRQEDEKEKRKIIDEEEEKKTEGEEEEEHVDVDDCEVCPETQLSNNDDDRTQDLMMETEATEELQTKSQTFTETVAPHKSPVGNELQEEDMEVEVDDPVDTKGKAISPISISSNFLRKNMRETEAEEGEGREDPDVQEMSDVTPDVEPPPDHRVPECTVDCPICQRSFPVTEIEVHAAYCNGDVVEERSQEDECYHVKSRRRGGRRAEAMSEETQKPSNISQNEEKCYICQKRVPVRDFSRHTTLCFQRQSSTSAGKGNLLSALEQTESRDSEAGPSGSKVQPGDVIDLLDDDDDDEDERGEEKSDHRHVISGTAITHSPIRSFTPISEASDCLIDFRRHPRMKKVRQKRR